MSRSYRGNRKFHSRGFKGSRRGMRRKNKTKRLRSYAVSRGGIRLS